MLTIKIDYSDAFTSGRRSTLNFREKTLKKFEHEIRTFMSRYRPSISAPFRVLGYIAPFVNDDSSCIADFSAITSFDSNSDAEFDSSLGNARSFPFFIHTIAVSNSRQ